MVQTEIETSDASDVDKYGVDKTDDSADDKPRSRKKLLKRYLAAQQRDVHTFARRFLRGVRKTSESEESVSEEYSTNPLSAEEILHMRGVDNRLVVGTTAGASVGASVGAAANAADAAMQKKAYDLWLKSDEFYGVMRQRQRSMSSLKSDDGSMNQRRLVETGVGSGPHVLSVFLYADKQALGGCAMYSSFSNVRFLFSFVSGLNSNPSKLRLTF